MNFLKLLPIIFSYLLMAAHFSRASNLHMSLIFLFLPLTLLIKKKWIIYITSLFLTYSAYIWIETAYKLIEIRKNMGMPYLRLSFILGTVALLTIISILIFKNKKLFDKYNKNIDTSIVSAISFILTFVLLSIAANKVKFPIILIDRFLPGTGGVEILILATYSAFISEKILNLGFSKIRTKIWSLFSLVFFLQFALGLSGFTKFLMTGKLHLPIPALIVGAPIFRGNGFFMIILFSITIILAGSAWCSFFCYIGAWDNLFANKNKPLKQLKVNPRIIQGIILIFVILIAFTLNKLGVSGAIASIIALIFMFIGIIIMLFISRKLGTMVHCTAYCPIGILSTTFGKINPFRVKINENCTDCMKCTVSCKYHCLTKDDVKKRTPSLGCTLCGDCVDSCPHNALNFYYYNSKKFSAKKVFVVIVSVIHAVFLGVARI